ncbi:hypothetical protein QUF64_03370 [Anaerolineales bacterium HSG6]|nr:hypothetical protein [Anaerolineales bacterium HSG6]MDM8531599.1 hypothetical protein [Anaerolineales bacterium HSG25]
MIRKPSNYTLPLGLGAIFILLLAIILIATGQSNQALAQSDTDISSAFATITPTPNQEGDDSDEGNASMFPSLRPRGPEGEDEEPTETPTPTPIPLKNVVQNGGFETPGPRDIGAAKGWERYENGGAHFAWYDEQWREAVYSGKHSQLMEIYEVFNNKPYRTMAIYQTVPVLPQSNYLLTVHAIMRTKLFHELRNQGDFALDVGIDYSGRGDYNAVEFQGGWINIDLPEQSYHGSQTEHQDDQMPLQFTNFKTIINSGESRQITLFIRGAKRPPDHIEVNFNIDEVSLIGPDPSAPQPPQAIPAVVEEAVDAPPEVIEAAAEDNLPNAGGVLPSSTSHSILLVMGLVMLIMVMVGMKSIFPAEE